MREIKFRAWDTARKEMVAVLEMRFMFETLNGIMVSGYDNKVIDHTIFPEHLELMQFTGLKDKHGKEIYEGDIVKAKGFNLSRWDRKYKHILTRTVAWGDGAWILTLSDGYVTSGIGMHNANGNRFEVIGNIYENPELVSA